jgi:hypothetical protein
MRKDTRLRALPFSLRSPILQQAFGTQHFYQRSRRKIFISSLYDSLREK